MTGMSWRAIRRFLSDLPLGTRLYFYLWTLLVPTGLALLFVGMVVPGLVLLVTFVFDQAVFTPLIVARNSRRRRSAAGQPGDRRG
jgi:hypothetical protein